MLIRFQFLSMVIGFWIFINVDTFPISINGDRFWILINTSLDTVSASCQMEIQNRREKRQKKRYQSGKLVNPIDLPNFMGSSEIFFSRVGGKIGGEKSVNFFGNITEGSGPSCIDDFTLVNNIETFRPGFI